jgi:hypothetical protein
MAARGKTGLVLAAIGARAACRVGFLRAPPRIPRWRARSARRTATARTLRATCCSRPDSRAR